MRAKRSFGQHFLHDGRVLHRIAASLEATETELICEVGPGTGRLTRRLVDQYGAHRVLCIEMDRDMVAHLAEFVPDVRVISADAARVDWSEVIGDRPAVLCGNLPYNASTAIYFNLMLAHRRRFRRLVLMFQKEVAQRLLAEPGSKRYGPPSVITAVLGQACRVVDVPPGAFRPKPRVDSMVMRVDPLATPALGLGEADVGPFHRFVKTAFQQRRKTIWNNLKVAYGEPAAAALEQAGVDRTARAETLAPATLVTLWRHVVGTAR